MMLGTLIIDDDWVLCLSLNILLTYIPHLALRVPAVHAKLAADQ